MGEKIPFFNFGANKNVRVIKTGEEYACVILQGDDVKCWGKKMYGQLGNEDGGVIDKEDGDHSGYTPTESKAVTLDGDATPIVKLGTGVTASVLSCGGKHTCIISNEGKVKCWGDNDFRQCGNNRQGRDPGTMGNNLQNVLLLNPESVAIYVSAGFEHTCAILISGQLYRSGRNNKGQLGAGNTLNQPQPNVLGYTKSLAWEC